jgi:hypothetical protein
MFILSEITTHQRLLSRYTLSSAQPIAKIAALPKLKIVSLQPLRKIFNTEEGRKQRRKETC